MENGDLNWIANFIWSVADLIGDTFKRGKYQDVILPLTVLRRIDCVLAPTKQHVLETNQKLKGKLDNLGPQLCKASGYAFYNTSLYDWEKLLSDAPNLAANLRNYIAGFSDNMREVLDKFDFDNTIAKLDQANLLYLVMERLRLNRIHPDKEDTMVLDFANDAQTIQAGFEPYYDRTILTEGTDPNALYDLEQRLEDLNLFTAQDVDAFANVYFNPKATHARLHTALQPTVDRFKAAQEDDKTAFRGALREYVRLYAFLSQVVRFADADLEKLYVFGRLLLRRLPPSEEQLPVEIQQQIDIDSYRVQKTSEGRIELRRGQGELEPRHPAAVVAPPPNELERLSQIIRELNERFGTDFTEADKVFLQDLEARLAADPALAASVRVNTRDSARLTFDYVATDKVQDMIDMNSSSTSRLPMIRSSAPSSLTGCLSAM